MLKEGLHVRFGPTEFEDFFGDLTKLRQSSRVHDYQTQFEKLLSRAGRLTPAQHVGCFISGLKESIRIEVQASQPLNLLTVVGLARLYEAKLTTANKCPVPLVEILASTHNFLKEYVATKLGLVLDNSGQLDVKMASGERLSSQGKCEGVELYLQGVLIAVDCYLLPLEGYKVMLGA
ncbi:hypothetical protein F0562_022263 [Nyssa sinensis]|uniref:Retrotransposon gag domain-containing protein n=1 Tax=Nyssa sinensis TaxID=561372 RepID=A0A5J5BSQ1_9ASTE|nr:hypothetical protein F0562_022263 [Nyssa sinensis]